MVLAVVMTKPVANMTRREATAEIQRLRKELIATNNSLFRYTVALTAALEKLGGVLEISDAEMREIVAGGVERRLNVRGDPSVGLTLSLSYELHARDGEENTE